ncbi:hypothetical protein DDB_G0285289 [Dictyostelium discoideum AX4]|uniref:Uncharacterized protein n=1 Tax=Dictyostelium discoideum TaxID=44689 RepID=Q54NF4_DICDI|nr:hypothetical protein DDB_G0285289 [Dictyostelium discoideum AX4]EAL64808.1 hypothetical protein DDB_G0285289 [Dictyostelium discoideum AX4]|eukprot:XP_638315.1 hypothetical protein DDB_G0285289 [Dictyostelium discoideum AX4]
MTSQYKVAKEQGNTFVYQPTNSPNIFSTAVETSPKPLMANEKIIKTEKVWEEKQFPDNSSFTTVRETKTEIPGDAPKWNSTDNLSSGSVPMSTNIPTAPPLPPVTRYPLNDTSKGPLSTQLANQKGHLKKVDFKEPTLFDRIKEKVHPTDKATAKPLGTSANNTTTANTTNAPLKPTSTTANTTNAPLKPTSTTASTNPTAANASTLNDTSRMGTKTNAAKTGDHYVEPHKPSQVKHVKGILKEKVGHLTKNARMEENGKLLEAQFEKEKFDYQAYQHNGGK